MEPRPGLKHVRAFLFTLIPLAMLATAAGCRRDLYSWGPYEDSVYSLYLRADEYDVPVHVEWLSRHLGQAESEGENVPPGFHAHLGYLYYLSGNDSAAVEHLEAEKAKFPESAIFIDGLLERRKRESK